jgi:2-desacetyl-2-hydroxyethyl bacteriochlorophyllide A dehydrogenase
MAKALIYAERSITLGEIDDVAIGPDDVAVEVAFTGICGTDLHIYHGDMDARVPKPLVPGHEMSGRIAEVGSAVSGWSIGQAVTVIPTVTCGACPACDAGNSHVCHRLSFLGIDAAGSMQSRWVVPAANLVALPESLDLQAAALVEPLAVAVHDVRRAGLHVGERVLVVGGGPVGLLIALVAKHEGAEVVLSEMDAGRRAAAEQLGLTTLDPAQVEVPAELHRLTGDRGADVAFEVSGSVRGVEAAVHSLAVRGRLVMVAIHSKPIEVDLFRFFWRELTLIGARLYDRSDYERAIELASDGSIPVAELITGVVTMEVADEAYRSLEAGQGMKILIDCQSAG